MPDAHAPTPDTPRPTPPAAKGAGSGPRPPSAADPAPDGGTEAGPRFTCLGARPDPCAAAPTLLMRLRVADPAPGGVHAIALRCQLRIEPGRRRYGDAEAELLLDLFGEPSRWGETLKPLHLGTASLMVPRFTGAVELDLPVTLSYDLEVAAGKYFSALDEGGIPLLLLFSGTVFEAPHPQHRDGAAPHAIVGGGRGGFAVRQVPWHHEARYDLPVAMWRDLMDRHFPGEGWLRLRRDTLRDLHRYKSARALATFDETVAALIRQVGI